MDRRCSEAAGSLHRGVHCLTRAEVRPRVGRNGQRSHRTGELTSADAWLPASVPTPATAELPQLLAAMNFASAWYSLQLLVPQSFSRVASCVLAFASWPIST